MIRKTLAEEMAERLREAILAGAWPPGTALPTEPELAGQFGVSRAVVRDATRLLSAWGLVDPRQGKGVYVTDSQREGFSKALLLSLRREGASVWDVEQFDRILFPEAAALVASRSREVDHNELRSYLDSYRAAIKEQILQHPGENWFTDEVRQAWYAFVDKFYDATGNRLVAYLGSSVARIKNVRTLLGDEDDNPERVVRRETEKIEEILTSMKNGDAEGARNTIMEMLKVPQEAENAMKRTEIGEPAKIPMDLEEFLSKRSS